MAASILVADDDAVSRKLLIRLLERDGHDVVCAAENGTQALERCRGLSAGAASAVTCRGRP